MIETITHQNKIYAIVVKKSFQSEEGIKFFSPIDFSLQFGYMKRPEGHIIPSHFHRQNSKIVNDIQEVIFVRSGKVKVNLYSEDNELFRSEILVEGEIIFLARGGHGFEMLMESELFEVKQGPYFGHYEDKILTGQIL